MVQTGHCKNSGLFFFFFIEKEIIHQLGTGFLVHHRIVSAVKRVEFLSGMMSCIVLRGRWCNVIDFNVNASSEEKSDDSKDSLYEELEQIFDHFPEYHTKILLGHFIEKMGRERIF